MYFANSSAYCRKPEFARYGSQSEDWEPIKRILITIQNLHPQVHLEQVLQELDFQVLR
jgi:UDP-glucose 6-dehydrogenase